MRPHRPLILRLSALLVFVLAIGLVLSCSSKKVPPVGPDTQPPAAPTNLTSDQITDSTFILFWQDNSDNETGFIVYYWSGINHLQDVTAANQHSDTITGVSAGNTYLCWVKAFNSADTSASSNQIQVTTNGANLPYKPTLLFASSENPYVVNLTWVNNDHQPWNVISRKTTGAYATIDTVAGNATEYVDSTVQPLTTYTYRVGAASTLGVNWCNDPATVTTPTANSAPQAPESLRVRVLDLNNGVELTWIDRSLNETKFDIQRQLRGQQWSALASVAADTTHYTDIPPTHDVYNYRIRSNRNDSLFSNWIGADDPADYRYCSSGVIPLCTGNYWEYRETATTNLPPIRRTIVQARFVGTTDYYLFIQAPLAGGAPDSLYYWRNFEGEGCNQIDWPMPDPPNSQLLFQYPAVLGTRYLVDGDTVQVVATGTQLHIQSPDTVFTGVNVYERYGHDFYYKWYVEPNYIGVIAEEQYNVGGTVLQKRYELTGWGVNN